MLHTYIAIWPFECNWAFKKIMFDIFSKSLKLHVLSFSLTNVRIFQSING